MHERVCHCLRKILSEPCWLCQKYKCTYVSSGSDRDISLLKLYNNCSHNDYGGCKNFYAYLFTKCNEIMENRVPFYRLDNESLGKILYRLFDNGTHF